MISLMKNYLASLFILLSLSLFAQDTSSYQVSHKLGRDFLLQGKYTEAITQLDSAISILPYGSEMYYERGYAKVQLKKYKEAILDFSMVINKNPEKYHAYIHRGIARYHIGNFYGAEKDIKQALYYDPTNQLAQNFLNIVNNVIRKSSDINSTELAKIHKKVTIEQQKLEKERYQTRRQQEDSMRQSATSIEFWTTTFLTW